MREQSVVFAQNQPRDLTRLIAALSSFPKELALKVTWGEAKRERSDAQNSALFGLAYEILEEHTGYTKQELHHVFCCKIFGEVDKEIMGTLVTMPARTTTVDESGKKSKLSTKEFAAFFSRVQQIASEMGVWIPDPDNRWSELKEMREAGQ